MTRKPIFSRARWPLAALAAILLLLGSPLALDAARRAIHAWLESFLPAMLPFLLLTPFLTGPDARAAFDKGLDAPFRALFRVPGRAAGAIVAGFIAGSPAGSIACAAAKEDMTPGEYERCAYMASGLSPAFLLTSVGTGFLKSTKVGWILVFSQYAALLIGGLLLRGVESGKRSVANTPTGADNRDVILTAFLQCARVCGWMIVFAALSALAAARLRGYIPGWSISAVCEIAGGSAEIASLPLPLEARAVLIAFASGFGGLCVGAQCASVTGVSPLRMLLIKFLHAALSAVFCMGALRFPTSWEWPSVPDAFALSGFAVALAALCVCIGALSRERTAQKN